MKQLFIDCNTESDEELVQTASRHISAQIVVHLNLIEEE